MFFFYLFEFSLHKDPPPVQQPCLQDAWAAVWSPALVSSAIHSIRLKGERIKEQTHDWIYITHLDEIFIFWFFIKNAGELQTRLYLLSVFSALDAASGRFVGTWWDLAGR